jgi:phage/plasmid-like protein (TIGR03299 family)
MAHNLAQHTDEAGNTKHSFFSLRESAWHKLGQVVDAPVSDREALKIAGLDWTANEEGLRLSDNLDPVPTHKCIVRSDTKAQLGVVTTGYTPVQNSDLFEWLRGLEGFADDVIIETAGALGKGETVWVMAKCPGLRMSIGGDEIQGYMLLANGHGGNRRLQILPTTVRVCCQNTLAMSTVGMHGKAHTNSLSTGYQLRHSKNIKSMMQQVQHGYAQTTDAWARTEQALRFLASKPMTEMDTFRMFNEPFLTPEQIAEQEAGDEGEMAASIRANREASIREILASETCQVPGTKDTIFSAMQAVTEYVDHAAPSRDAEGATAGAGRFESANFGGKGETTKRNAYALAMELALA